MNNCFNLITHALVPKVLYGSLLHPSPPFQSPELTVSMETGTYATSAIHKKEQEEKKMYQKVSLALCKIS